MSDKIPFTFMIRQDERAALKRLAQMSERSEGTTLRYLIRMAAKELDADAMTQSEARPQTGTANHAIAG
jgi:hypothetical protein